MLLLTDDKPTTASRHPFVLLPARVAHSYTHSTICIRANTVQVRNTDPRNAQGKTRAVQKGAKNNQTSHALWSGVFQTARAKSAFRRIRQGDKNQLFFFFPSFLQVFFFFLPVWLAGRLPAQNASARAGQNFLFPAPRQAAGIEDPWFRGLRFCSRRTDQRPWRGFADAGESL